MEGSILELLEQHGSLASEQIAAHLNMPPDRVRNDLNNLHERGWIQALKVGHLHGERDGPAYWYLTGAGHEELARRRRAS